MLSARAKQLQDLLDLLVVGDPRLTTSPAINKTNIEKIFREYGISETMVSGNPIDDLFIGLRYALACHFSQFFKINPRKNTPILRGYVSLYWKYFSSSVISQYSLIIQACCSPKNVDEFSSYLAEVHGDEKKFALGLTDWFHINFGENSAALISEADRRNLGKHEEKALEKFAISLNRISPSIFDVVSVTELVVPQTQEVDAGQAISLVQKLMIRCYPSAPASFGVDIPVGSCIPRSVRVESSVQTTVTDALSGIQGKSGIIVGRPFSGVSTFMRMLAVEGKSLNNLCIVYIPASSYMRYVLTHQRVYEYIVDLMVYYGLLDLSTHSLIITQLRNLDRDKKLVLLVDELRSLDNMNRALVIQNLSFSPCVIYSANLRDAEDLLNSLAEFYVELCKLELLELDLPQQDQLLSVALSLYKQEDERDLFFAMLKKLRMDPGEHDIVSSPLGVLALVVCARSLETMCTDIMLSVLNETLTRLGFDHFELMAKNMFSDSPNRVTSDLLLFAGWMSCFAKIPRSMTETEINRLAWRLQKDNHNRFSELGLLTLLESPLFEGECYRGNYGQEWSYRFLFRDFGLLFIAIHTYFAMYRNYQDPQNNLWYTNFNNPQLEKEVNTMLADLKEYLKRHQ